MGNIRAITGRNFVDLWKNHWFLIVLLIGAFALDTISTIHFMTHLGVQSEIHPLVRHSAIIFGTVPGVVLSCFIYKSIATVLLALYLKKIRFWILFAPIVPAVLAGYINFL